MKRRFEIIVGKTDEGCLAYPIGLHGVVTSDGDTFEEAIANVRKAIAFHIETFGAEGVE